MLRLFSLVLLTIACVADADIPEPQSFTLYLVRHAEKLQDGSRDPLLTEAGKSRAESLSLWLKDKRIRDIWSTDYQRTRSTAKPLIQAQGSELKLYDPRQLQQFGEQLLNNQVNALVVGHSNTTPELARVLCKCEIEAMDETEYDRLISILIRGQDVVSVITLQQTSLPE